MTYEDMRKEFYFLKDENITNLDAKDLPGEKWFPIYHNGDWFITELSNYGRFKIGHRIIKRMPDPVPFGLITILYRDILNAKGNNKSLFIHAIDVMRSCRDYYGEEMFDIITSNGIAKEGTTYSETTNGTTYSETTNGTTYSETTNGTTYSETTNVNESVVNVNGKDILVFNNDGDLVGEYSSISECAKWLNVSYKAVDNAIYRNSHIYYKYRIFRRSEIDGKTKIEPKYYHEIRLYDPAGHFVEEFADSKEVLNRFKMSNIDTTRNFCVNRAFSRQCNGYLIWKKEVGNAETIEISNTVQNYSKIIVLDTDYNKLKEFKTYKDAAKYMGLAKTSVYYATTGKNDHYYKGYYFYKESEYLKKIIYKEED